MLVKGESEPGACMGQTRMSRATKVRLTGFGWAVVLLAALTLTHPAFAYSHFAQAPRPYVGIRSEPTTSGVSWVVMDANTGRILSENEPYTLRYPASLTKLMTLDLAFRALRDNRITLNTALPVSSAAADVQPVKLNLVAGQTITVQQAMLGMTTLSANDAATALGQYLGGGSLQRIAALMTDRAHQLGMLRTEFTNPSGLPNPNQVTDAYDMAILARHILLTYPRYRYLFSVPSFTFEGREIPNIDGMLKLYPDVIGMKTGFTDLARFNLVTAAIHNGHLLIGVELHAQSWRVAYRIMTHLLNQGFAAEKSRNPRLVVADNAAQPRILASPPRRAEPRVIASAQTIPHDKYHRVVGSRSIYVTEEAIPGWTAQVGAYYSYADAKRQAILIRDTRHSGTARIGSAIVNGRRIWRAQIAGLNRVAAERTCSFMASRHQSCFVIGPRPESIAMR